jgi:hypothetical protein
MKEYINRYGDKFTFTENVDHDILWEGNFEFCRFGMPNDYTKAYKEYLKDNSYSDHCMTLEQFKEDVHKYDDETLSYDYPKYITMVESLRDEIDMVDPSGGPYLSVGMSMDSLGFEGYKIEDFKKIDTGYKIIIEKCPLCHQAGGIHKMSCATRKIIINIMEDDEKLGLYDT